MSVSGKKNRERSCLEKVFSLKGQGRGYSKRLIASLEGEVVCEGERPDFIVRPNCQNNNPVCYLGIEHFVVDQEAERGNKNPSKWIGHSVQHELEMRKICENYREGVLADDNESFEALYRELASALAGMLQDQRNSSYFSFLEHLEYCLQNHLSKVDEYRGGVADYLGVDSCNVKIAFLVDARTNFENLYITKPSGETRRCPHGFMPMFEDVVDILEQAQGRIDYLILVLNPTISCANPRVIPLDCSNLRWSLSKQGISTCVFAGSELYLGGSRAIGSNFKVSGQASHDKDASSFQFGIAYEQADEKTLMDSGLYGAFFAWSALRDGKAVVTDTPVQTMLTSFGSSLVGWCKPNPENKESCPQPILRNFSKRDSEKRLEEFRKKHIETTDVKGAGGNS